MFMVLSSVQCFCEDICCLFRIAAGFNHDGAILHQLPDPMPSHFDVLGPFMELGVMCQCNRPFIVTDDRSRAILMKPAPGSSELYWGKSWEPAQEGVIEY